MSTAVLPVGRVEGQPIKQGLSQSLSPGWQAPTRDAEGWEKDLILELAKTDLQLHPELGFEIDGRPVSVSWPDHRIEVIGDEDDHAGLEAAGWIVVDADADASAILDLLESRGA